MSEYLPAPSVYAPAVLDDTVEVLPKAQLPDQSVLEGIYAGLNVEVGLLYQDPVDDDDLEGHYLTSKLWRMNNLYTIVDKDGERIPFVMNLSQHKVYASILTWYRILILKSRQQGISTFWLLCYFDDALFYPDLNVGLMAQGKGEAKKLLKRVKLAWRCLDPSIKGLLGGIKIESDNNEEIGFSNGSSIFIQVSFRSAALQRLHVSELGKIANNTPERARELKTGTMQAIKPGNPVAIESTAEGENMFKDMWETAVSNSHLGAKDFYPVFLSWVYDPDCVAYIDEEVDIATGEYFAEVESALGVVLTVAQKNFWVMQHRELGEDIYQEYPSTPTEAFIAIKDGTYYSRLYMEHVIIGKREVSDLYDPTLSVQVAMDLGFNDTFVLVYYQRVGREVRIIDEYVNSGYEIEHYVNNMKSKPYVIDNVELPHDGGVHELQTGMTRKAFMRALGVTNIHQVASPPGSVDEGIDQVRRMIPNLWIDVKCKYIIKSFKKYTKKWDAINEVWKNKPLHNEASNGADAVRVMARGRVIQSTKINRISPHRPNNNDVIDGMAI